MRVVHVASLESGPLTAQTAGTERRKASAVRHFGERIRLVHELRQLPRSKKLPQGGCDRPDVDQIPRHGFFEIRNRRHAFPGDPLHTKQADADLVLEKLPDGADTPVSEVIDIVILGFGVLQVDEPENDALDVVKGQETLILRDGNAEAPVHLVASDTSQIVASGVEEETVNVFPGVFYPGRFVRAQSSEHFENGLVRARRPVLLNGRRYGAVDIPD